jgi:hypothetical protein
LGITIFEIINTGSADYDDASTYNANQKKYVLETCIATHNQEHCRIVIKNKFLLRKV